MQVLTISDETRREVYGPTAKERFAGVKLILSCGDLRPSYLEFVVSTLNVPLLYVHGNHDSNPEITESGRVVMDPEGCIHIDGRIVEEAGLVIAGLGGAPWYNGEKYQYTELHMYLRVLRLAARLRLRELRNDPGLDIMITHAAPKGIHDGTGAHRGFRSFRWLIDRFQPRYFIHGHVHPSYGFGRETESVVGGTTVINTVGYKLLEIEPVGTAVEAQENVQPAK